MNGLGPALMAGLAAILAIASVRELTSEGGLRLESTLEPLRRAHREGYLPTSDERFRLALLFAVAAALGGWWLVGPIAGMSLVVVSPLAAGWTIARGARRYRRAVERSLADAARAIADCLSAGHSPRGALVACADSLGGPIRNEFDRLGYELESGAATADAIRSFALRSGSSGVDAFATALVSQRLAGGDLAALLRRFAEGAAERERVAEDARSATAQARFTGYLVVAMPIGGALFTELLRPGFLGSIVDSVPALVLVALSAGMQLGGFLAISKLARIGGT
ncbi:MAG: type II secretion system F family protein [Solirubrobacterales bacterium]|nr:type II secretion system F family protein [Solirubrobacterales bacterium]